MNPYYGWGNATRGAPTWDKIGAWAIWIFAVGVLVLAADIIYKATW
jgi:hypothetical protein